MNRRASDLALEHPSLEPGGWRWRAFVLVVAVVPVLSVNLNYLISSHAGFIPKCLTYMQGCTSISATGRYGVSYYLFKVFMLPQAVLLIVFWRIVNRHWPARGSRNALLAAGVIGAMFLVLYTVFLGSQGDVYRLMRRYGVFVFFLGTLIAQIAATRRLSRSGSGALVTVQRALLILMGLLAIAEVPLGTFGLQDDQAENVIEWNFALLMQLWFLSWWWARRQRDL